MPGHHKNGFSLVEMLIALAVSAIIIAAAFGSYAMIARNFDFQKDMKYIAQSARAVVDMVNSDIRLAGYTAVDNGAITDAVMLSDSGTATCCDAISVVYDQTPTERRQVTYYTKQYTSDDTRFRLYKHICQVTSPLTIAEIQAGQCPATATLLAENPIADYVEDLQFSGTRKGVVASSGELACNAGTKQRSKPITATSSCPGNSNPMLAFDGNNSTYWTSTTIPGQACFINFSFAKEVEILDMYLATAAHIDGGSVTLANENVGNGNMPTAVNPYGIDLPAKVGIRLMPESNMDCVRCANDPPQFPGSGTSCNGNGSGADKPVRIMGTLARCDVETHLNGFAPGNSNQWCFTNGHDGWMGQGASKNWKFRVNSPHDDVGTTGAQKCVYNGGVGTQGCNLQDSNLQAIAEIAFEVNQFGYPQTPYEIETSILIRSPNEHGNVDRSVGSPLTLGNRTNTWSDKHLRDSFTTATVVRNLYYSSQ